MAKPVYTLPKGAWDSHVHIVDEDHWQISDDATYHPKQANLDQLMSFENSIGIDHVCIVALSVYMEDNASIFNSLQRLGGKGRGVAMINPDTITDAELDSMHTVGFRGVRINLRTRSESYDTGLWHEVLHKHAAKIRRLNWVIQLFVSMDQIPNIAPVLSTLGLRVVFDHLGYPEGHGLAIEQPGCNELLRLLETYKDVYVKLSGLYRLPETPDMDVYIRKLLQIAPDQIVWASDWTFTAGQEYNPGGDRKALQDFLTPDIPAFVGQCVHWCDGRSDLIRKIWVDNPTKLWD
ncbi:hypothetical protein LTR96_008154 [Exophiala xenobiotica]|uniref:Amidohydrolase-related domain-containing protein n=1 Tax=Vermiconidia calcicola TaxID=1690605 RepID=A0AAV9PTW0_9PEZI|nr:hypothetical protein LTR92_009881 [Exophiala xenobiotica]KAK5529089.1 hypothetical protein LTR25_009826 [Vermiconidia calcicola]KAK5529949.1 hypothetical protein LTR23_010501 [Chaetothyriales sp. CCFEE 6169]KAK5266307.1 hypothetical protein LTR96_008154 [Exophiala xenobiotica]KAK5337756.1 hypothetical protein LTR98_005605 [Exophiala xenobiotica]